MKINKITKVNIGKSGKRMLTLDELKKLRIVLWIRIKHGDDKPNDPGKLLWSFYHNKLVEVDKDITDLQFFQRKSLNFSEYKKGYPNPQDDVIVKGAWGLMHSMGWHYMETDTDELGRSTTTIKAIDNLNKLT